MTAISTLRPRSDAKEFYEYADITWVQLHPYYPSGNTSEVYFTCIEQATKEVTAVTNGPNHFSLYLLADVDFIGTPTLPADKGLVENGYSTSLQRSTLLQSA